jgi:hypothetical protein
LCVRIKDIRPRQPYKWETQVTSDCELIDTSGNEGRVKIIQQIPNYQTSVRNPDDIQRRMDADQREMNILKWMQAEDELRQLPRQVF